MKETKTKKSTYLRNFIIAVALSAAILAAGALWVLLGWRSALDITLTDLAGDPAALRGFTMRGQSYFDTAHTYWDLHDGYLDTSFALDPDESDDRYHYSAWGASHTTFYAVTPETRDEVNAAAQRVQVYDDNWQMQSTASHFRVMVEISMGSDVLRVALRDVVLDAPISVSANAEVPTTYLDRTSVSYDYTADFSDEVEDTNTDYRYIAGQIFSLGDGRGLAWRYTVADRKAGLYKATPISYDDLAALPADGKVGDRDVLCATTEFGTLEPFYCPENARQVVCGLPMDDGLTLCVYLDPLNKACADLVNAAGEQVDHVDLGIEGDNGDFSVTALPRTTDRDAVLKVDYGSTLVALRVQDGKFILNKSLSIEGNIDLNSVDLYMRNAEDAVLNTAGDALLIATPEYTTVGDANAENSYNIYQTGTLLLVTHDRHLMNSLACPILYLEDGKAVIYPSYDALMGRAAPAPVAEKSSEPAKAGYGKEQRRRRAELRAKIKACEDEMEACGAREVELENEINSPEVYNDPQLLREKSDELSDLRFHQDELFAAWEAAVEEQEQYEQTAGSEE